MRFLLYFKYTNISTKKKDNVISIPYAVAGLDLKALLVGLRLKRDPSLGLIGTSLHDCEFFISMRFFPALGSSQLES